MTEPSRTSSKQPAGKLPADNSARVFTSVLAISGIVWLALATLLVLGVAAIAPEHLRETILVTILSGMVAAISLTPGLVNEWSPQANRSASDSNAKQNYLGPIFGGIILRLVATVALFVMCRYQMAESVQWIAALTIGWYLVLTSVEVTLLARKLPKLDASSTVAPMITSGLVPTTIDLA